jgi:hypothetical protein
VLLLLFFLFSFLFYLFFMAPKPNPSCFCRSPCLDYRYAVNSINNIYIFGVFGGSLGLGLKNS